DDAPCTNRWGSVFAAVIATKFMRTYACTWWVVRKNPWKPSTPNLRYKSNQRLHIFLLSKFLIAHSRQGPDGGIWCFVAVVISADKYSGNLNDNELGAVLAIRCFDRIDGAGNFNGFGFTSAMAGFIICSRVVVDAEHLPLIPADVIGDIKLQGVIFAHI